jgi:octaprenyl-diphosphate synthase
MDNNKNIIEKELNLFETYFRNATKTKVALLDKIMHYIIQRKGKQMRPKFVLLAAKLGGNINDETYRAAALVELLHTATLVHDDVVDESFERRGFFSINALWNNKVAVLVGDYLLSKGLLLSIDNKDYQILEIVSTAVKNMSEGELLQMEKARNLNIDESIYYEIIKGKTASLLASACAAGASTTFANKEEVEKMRLFGENTGMAFQIKDDLFDYGTANVGKPTGNDIKEKKLTLPLIYTLNNCDADTRKKIIYIVKNNNKDKQKIKFVLDTVVAVGGIAYAQQQMENYKNKALEILATFENNEANKALLEMVLYTTNRKY